MIDWTKDERITAMLPQVTAHMDAHDELSLEHEAQMNDIREDYLDDLWLEYVAEHGTENDDDFEEWHNQPTVEEFVTFP
jgi:hypothetical protein